MVEITQSSGMRCAAGLDGFRCRVFCVAFLSWFFSPFVSVFLFRYFVTWSRSTIPARGRALFLRYRAPTATVLSSGRISPAGGEGTSSSIPPSTSAPGTQNKSSKLCLAFLTPTLSNAQRPLSSMPSPFKNSGVTVAEAVAQMVNRMAPLSVQRPSP